MSVFLRAACVVAAIALSASVAQAQQVAMAGQYHESNGIIVNIPQNPPIVDCDETVNDARCGKREQHFFFQPAIPVYNKPQVGNRAALNIDTVAGNGGLDPGDAFVVPPLAFTQMLGVQVGQVLNNVTIQLDTYFTAAMPGTSRTKLPDVANTRLMQARSFSPGNMAAHGQNNGLATTNVNYDYREALNTTHTFQTGSETLTMEYKGGGGFGGTMSVLLDGAGRLYLAGANIDAIFAGITPPVLPVIGTNPVGDDIPGLNIRNGPGWDYTVVGMQDAGLFKGFPSPFPTPLPNGLCGPDSPPSPDGCNLVFGFDTFGAPLAPLPTANSTKHMFAWTTGTVSIVRAAVRNAVPQTDTLTGMGFDTVGTGMILTPGGGTTTIPQRNVGLVAGSFTRRLDGTGSLQVNTQLVGVNMKFTPEPGATIALISGLGLLGAFAARRRA